MKKFNKKQMEYLNEHFKIYEDDDMLTLESWTDLGVDMLIDIWKHDCNKRDYMQQLQDFYDNFDVDEEIDLHRESEKYRQAFRITQSVKDFTDWESFIEETLIELAKLEQADKKNGIRLKFGTLKGWHFDEEFCSNNKKLVDDINNLYDKIYENCCSVVQAQEKNKDNENIKLELCDLLDKFFDCGVEIYNDFDNKKYKTKKSYRNYLLKYNENE